MRAIKPHPIAIIRPTLAAWLIMFGERKATMHPGFDIVVWLAVPRMPLGHAHVPASMPCSIWHDVPLIPEMLALGLQLLWVINYDR